MAPSLLLQKGIVMARSFIVWLIILGLKSALWANPLPIVNLMKVRHVPQLPADGVLSEISVLNILASILTEHLIDLPEGLMDPNQVGNCFKAKALGDNQKGVHSGQLFAISYNQACMGKENSWRSLYILKETKKGISEIRNLHEVHESILGQEKTPTKRFIEGALPAHPEARISFEDLHFVLTTQGDVRYFSLLQTAKGRSLHSILEDFGKSTQTLGLEEIEASEEYSKMQYIFYRIGYATSKLHQKYAQHEIKDHKILGKTYIHGDFHAQNIFYNEENGDVTLIDNETFAMSLTHRTSGVNDIVDLYLLHSVETLAHHFAQQLFTNADFGIDDATWHKIWRQLLLGYIEAYDNLPKEKLYDVQEELTEKFRKGLSNWWLRHLRNLGDQRKLKRLGPSGRRVHLRLNLDNVFEELYNDLIDYNMSVRCSNGSFSCPNIR